MTNVTTEPYTDSDEAEDEANAPERKLADRLPLEAAADLIAIIRLVLTYMNRSTRHRFRPEAEEHGFDVGKPSERNPALYEVGPLEAMIQDLPAADRG